MVVFERVYDLGELEGVEYSAEGAIEISTPNLPPSSPHLTKLTYIHHPAIVDGVTRFVLFVRDSEGQEFAVRSIDYDTTHFPDDQAVPVYFPIWIPDKTPSGTYPANLRIIYPDGTDWIHPETLFELVISE